MGKMLFESKFNRVEEISLSHAFVIVVVINWQNVNMLVFCCNLSHFKEYITFVT